MVICDGCPFIAELKNSTPFYFNKCHITGIALVHNYRDRGFGPLSGICPIKCIEFKDGTVFKPEVAGDGEN